MNEQLTKHISKFVAVGDDELVEINTFFKVVNVKKKANLLVAGDTCNQTFFVSKGLLRKFFISDKGVENTTEFALENWWLTDVLSFTNRHSSEFYIQAVENAEVLSLSRENYRRLLHQHPAMEKYFRCIFEKAYGAAQMRIKYQYDFSREELYHHFRLRYPEFLQRVPQYLIASYLGFTPEYLSEIRRKSLS